MLEPFLSFHFFQLKSWKEDLLYTYDCAQPWRQHVELSATKRNLRSTDTWTHQNKI